MTLDTYYPVEVEPGANANMERWRRMARHWCRSGVVLPRYSPLPGEQGPLAVYHWDGANFHVAPGACWADGCFGYNREAKFLPGTGNPGLIVARLDPVAQEIRIIFREGIGPGGEIRDPNGWFEVPLAWFQPGELRDLRYMVPAPPLPPPITEVPSWVPRGVIEIVDGPGSNITLQPGQNTDLLVSYVYVNPLFIPSRHYRFTFRARLNSGLGTGAASVITAYVRDDVYGIIKVENIWNAPSQYGEIPDGCVSIAARYVGGGLVGVISARVEEFTNTVLANNCTIEVEDMGDGYF